VDGGALMRLIRLFSLAVSILATLNGPLAAADAVEIPVLLSTTGNFAFIGKQEVDSFQIVEKAVNRTGGIRGRQLHFAVTDDQSSPVVTLQVATPILARHPAIVIGPDSTAQTSAVLPLLTPETVLYSLSVAYSPPSGSSIFSVMIGNFELFSSAVKYLRKKGLTRLALISTTDASGVDQLQQIERVVALPENKGVSLVAKESFALTELNV